MEVLSVVGARPQFIKAFVVSRELRPHHEETLVHTGQHYDDELSAVFFDELGLPKPDFNLGVGSGPHGQQTGKMIVELESLIESASPDAILCYGDTNSTLAAAIVGSKSEVVLGHVEAGIRSFNRAMPEEVNRILTDHAADLLFAPSEAAIAHLKREGLVERAHFTGDVMYASLLWARDQAAESSPILNELRVAEGEYILATVHRPRNTDNRGRLEAIVKVLGSAPLPVVFPAHPRTIEALESWGLRELAEDAMQVIPPVGYIDFVQLLNSADRVVTDSGGVQKEAFFLDTPCITLREESEWMETVDAGWNTLVGADSAKIKDALQREFEIGDYKPTPYGDTDAAHRIRNLLESATTSP